jgi:hypothetical protein
MEPAVPSEIANLEAAVQAKYAAPGLKLQSKDQNQGSVPNNEDTPEVGTPAEIRDLEAAVQAKYATSAGIPNLSTEPIAVGSQADVPPAVAELEAAVQAKYGADISSDEVAKQDGALYSALAGQVATEVAVSPEIRDLEAAVQARYSASSGIKLKTNQESLTSGSNVDVSPEIAELEAAVQAKYSSPSGIKLQSKQDSSVTGAHLDMPPEIAELEAAVQAKYSSPSGIKLQSKQQSSASGALSDVSPRIADLEASSDEAKPASTPISGATPEGAVPSDVRDLEAAVQAKYSTSSGVKLQSNRKSTASESQAEVSSVEEPGTEMESIEDAEQASVPSSSSADEAAKLAERRAEVEDVFHLKKEPKMTGISLPSSRMPKKKAKSKHRTPTIVHVETPHKERTPEQETIFQGNAAKIAEKRAEVENIFHLSSSTAEPEAEPDVQPAARAFRTLMRILCFVAAMAGFIGVAYSKFEVVSSLCQDNQTLKKFKAKQEDTDTGADGSGFVAASSYRHQSQVDMCRGSLRCRVTDNTGDFGV